MTDISKVDQSPSSQALPPEQLSPEQKLASSLKQSAIYVSELAFGLEMPKEEAEKYLQKDFISSSLLLQKWKENLTKEIQNLETLNNSYPSTTQKNSTEKKKLEDTIIALKNIQTKTVLGKPPLPDLLSILTACKTTLTQTISTLDPNINIDLSSELVLWQNELQNRALPKLESLVSPSTTRPLTFPHQPLNIKPKTAEDYLFLNKQLITGMMEDISNDFKAIPSLVLDYANSDTPAKRMNIAATLDKLTSSLQTNLTNLNERVDKIKTTLQTEYHYTDPNIYDPQGNPFTYVIGVSNLLKKTLNKVPTSKNLLDQEALHTVPDQLKNAYDQFNQSVTGPLGLLEVLDSPGTKEITPEEYIYSQKVKTQIMMQDIAYDFQFIPAYIPRYATSNETDRNNFAKKLADLKTSVFTRLDNLQASLEDMKATLQQKYQYSDPNLFGQAGVFNSLTNFSTQLKDLLKTNVPTPDNPFGFNDSRLVDEFPKALKEAFTSFNQSYSKLFTALPTSTEEAKANGEIREYIKIQKSTAQFLLNDLVSKQLPAFKEVLRSWSEDAGDGTYDYAGQTQVAYNRRNACISSLEALKKMLTETKETLWDKNYLNQSEDLFGPRYDPDVNAFTAVNAVISQLEQKVWDLGSGFFYYGFRFHHTDREFLDNTFNQLNALLADPKNGLLAKLSPES